MSETDASLKFDEPIEGPVTAPLSGEALTRSTSNSPATAVTNYATGSADDDSGFQPGMQIGMYRLISKLGEGGMGIVYKAMHTKLDKIVAIKLLPSAFLTQPSTLARFELEMKVVGRLEHPNIVRASDAGEQKGTHYLVMEFVEGTDLQRLVMMRGVLTIHNACKAIYQAALGLQAAHEAGVFHRDVKPSNLFVTKSGQIKVLDLGLARLSQDDGEGITKSGQVFGTPEYMAPEQWEDVHTCDGRTDLYALGCTLFFLLTGRPPYGGEEYKTAPRKMLGHINDAIPSLKSLRSDVPPDLEAIYRKLMSKKSADRFTSGKELAAALSPWIDGESGLSQLPLSASSVHQNAHAATIPERTQPDRAGHRPDSSITDGALGPKDQFAPTMMDPLQNAHGTTQAAIPTAEHRRRSNWLWPSLGSITALALIAGAAYVLLPKSGPTPSPTSTQASASNPDPNLNPSPEMNLEAMPMHPDFLNRWVSSSPSQHARRALVGTEAEFAPFAPEVLAVPVEVGAWEPIGLSQDVVVAAGLVREDVKFDWKPLAPFGADPEEIPLGPQRLRAPFDAKQIAAAQQDWAKELNLEGDKIETENSIGMELVLIPPGEFDMGPSNQQRRVKVSHALFVGKYEVTQKEFKQVTEKNPSRFSPTGPKLFQPKVKGLNTDRFPVESVTWEEAVDFCNQLSLQEKLAPYYSGARKVVDPQGNGYRLLTEAEWEYVCRAGTDTLFSFGQKLTGAQANIKDTQTGGGNLSRPQEVGQYGANQFQLYDLHGNVMEWCFDTERHKTNPNRYRVLRGGSWSSEAKDANSHFRNFLEPAQEQNNTGFRIARTIPVAAAP